MKPDQPPANSIKVRQEFEKPEWDKEAPDGVYRRAITPEEKEQMDRKVIALATLFKNWEGWWQVDGSLNISLRLGEYVGIHRDIDVSLLQEELPKLEEYLASRGYGFFLLTREHEPGVEIATKHIYRRVGAVAFQQPGKREVRRILAIDENGEIRSDIDLVEIEVALMRHDESGQLYSYKDKVSEHWLQGERIDFQGLPLELSHPARFLFHKIRYFRPGDEEDLRKFMELRLLTKTDIEEIQQLLEPQLEKLEASEKMYRWGMTDKDRAIETRKRLKWIGEMI